MFAFDQNRSSVSEDSDVIASLEQTMSCGDSRSDHTWNASTPIVFAPSPVARPKDRTWHSSLPIVFSQPAVRSSDAGRRNYTSSSQPRAPLKPVSKAGLKALPLAAYQSVPNTRIDPTKRLDENTAEVIRKLKEAQERNARMKAALEERRRKEERKRALEAKEMVRKRQLKLRQLAEAQRKLELERERERQIQEEKLTEARRIAAAARAETINRIAQCLNRLYSDLDEDFLELHPQVKTLTTAVTASEEDMQSIRDTVMIIERNLAQLRRREQERVRRAHEQEQRRLRLAQEEAQRLQIIKEFHTVQDLRIQEHLRQKEREAIEAKAETDDILTREYLLQQEEEAQLRYYRSVYREDYAEYAKMYRRYTFVEQLLNRSLENLAESHFRKSHFWKMWKDGMIFSESSLYDTELLQGGLDQWPVELRAPLQELRKLEAEVSLILDELAELFRYQGLFWQWHADRGQMMVTSFVKQAHLARRFTSSMTLLWTEAERRQRWIELSVGSHLSSIETTTNGILDIVCWKPESPYGANAIDVPVAIERLKRPQNIRLAWNNLDRIPLKSENLSPFVTLASKLLENATTIRDRLMKIRDHLVRPWLLAQGPAEQYHFLRVSLPFQIFGSRDDKSQRIYESIFEELYQLVRDTGWRKPPCQLAALDACFKDMIGEHMVRNRRELMMLGKEMRPSLDQPHMQALLEGRKHQLAAECRRLSSQNRRISRRDRIVENQKKSAERKARKRAQERSQSPKLRGGGGISSESSKEQRLGATGAVAPQADEKSNKMQPLSLHRTSSEEKLTQTQLRNLLRRGAKARRRETEASASSGESGKSVKSTSNAQHREAAPLVEPFSTISASSKGKKTKKHIETQPAQQSETLWRPAISSPAEPSTRSKPSSREADTASKVEGGSGPPHSTKKKAKKNKIETRQAEQTETLWQPINPPTANEPSIDRPPNMQVVEGTAKVDKDGSPQASLNSNKASKRIKVQRAEPTETLWQPVIHSSTRDISTGSQTTTRGSEAAFTRKMVGELSPLPNSHQVKKGIQSRRARQKETLRQPVNARPTSKSSTAGSDGEEGTLVGVPLVRRAVGKKTFDEKRCPFDEQVNTKAADGVKEESAIETPSKARPATNGIVIRKHLSYGSPLLRKLAVESGPNSRLPIGKEADLSKKSVNSKQSASFSTGFIPTRPLQNRVMNGVAADEEEEHEKASEDEHEPLTYQIPDDVLRKAMFVSPSSVAAFWSHTMYRGPNGEEVLVQYCRSKKTGEKVAQQFASKEVLGFDIEWKSGAEISDGIKANVSLVQLACEDRIGLFHLALHKGDTPDEIMPPTLRQIIESPNILKCGVAIRADFSRIQKHFGIEAKGMFELSYLHNLVKFCVSNPKNVTKRLVALKTQVEEHLLLPLFKGDAVRTSDWSKELNHDQCSYAAADAYASFRLFYVLEAKRLALDPVPERPACVEENKRIVLPEVIADSSSQDATDQDTAEVTDLESEEEECSSLEAASENESSSPDVADPVAEQLKLLDLTSLPDEVTPPDEDASSSGYETANELPLESGAIIQDYSEAGNFVGRLQLPKDCKADPPEQDSVWVKPPELLQAEAWVAEWKNVKSSRFPDTYKARVTSSALRAYAMWHYQNLNVGHVASLMRDKPLRKSTVSTYILDCIVFERLPYDGNRAKALFDDLPWSVHGKYDSIRRRLP